MDVQTRWPRVYAMLAAAEHHLAKASVILTDARNHRPHGHRHIKAMRANREDRDLILESWLDGGDHETRAEKGPPSDRGSRPDDRSQETLVESQNVAAHVVPPPSGTTEGPRMIPRFVGCVPRSASRAPRSSFADRSLSARPVSTHTGQCGLRPRNRAHDPTIVNGRYAMRQRKIPRNPTHLSLKQQKRRRGRVS
jgi:hypothetical protein